MDPRFRGGDKVSIYETASSGKFTGRLLEWFRRNKRDLPWRRAKSPYAVWISEVMLQQTGVKTVIPYFRKFLRKFPTVSDLADAPLEKVLKSWEGLGYYSRARHLHGAAREIRAKYGGKLPQTREELLKLPGIGPYTAGAVASIAFGEAVPVVDGNVWRVFSRILADPHPPEQGKKNVFELLGKIIPAGDPSSFNQALMELGSLVCTPQNPRCSVCPVRPFCAAYALKKVREFPPVPVRKPVPRRHWVVLIAVRGQKVLLRQRPLKGIWGGLWEFPALPVENIKNLKNAAGETARQCGLSAAEAPSALPPLRHAFSHFKLTLHPFLVPVQNSGNIRKGRWVDPRRRPCPMPAPYLKLLKAVL